MKTRLYSLVLLALVLVTAAACTSSSTDGQGSAGGTASTAAGSSGASTGPSTGSTPPSTPPSSSSSAAGPTRTVHVTSLISDGSTYGVGMPIVLFFTPAPTDSSAFTKAVKVTVNGQPADGAWFWSQPTADEVKSHTVEAHFRTRGYWPANAKIHVDTPIGGLSAGKGLVYSGKLTSVDFNTGAKHISVINGAGEKMRVYSNNKLVKTINVSLGKAKTPTFTGVKVVMQKGENQPGSSKLRPNGAVRMRGPGYDEIVDWSVRITRSGEYVHAAPWNSQIGQQSTSNGCTNLSVSDAKWYYGFANIGDVLTYANTGGQVMPSWDGFGDWNVPWTQWEQGGLLKNH
ncbi:MAG TPA: L,D-transpeptidase [Jatrophihabitans sp.]|jgi:lipoprotein-anchoring transpeptidase ErfK/SrfK|nr:L,D-transpeptidase [Jatrophihabitans sp.]